MLLNISLFKFVSILRCSFQFAKSPQDFLAGNNNLRNFIKIPIRFALGALGWWWFFFAHRQWSWWAACWLLCRIAWARPLGWCRFCVENPGEPRSFWVLRVLDLMIQVFWLKPYISSQWSFEWGFVQQGYFWISLSC